MSGLEIMARDVCIACAAADQAIGEAVCDAIEAIHLTCWIPTRDVATGSPAISQLIEAVSTCRYVVYVHSMSATAESALRRYLELASHKRKQIVIFDTDGSAIGPELAYFTGRSPIIGASGQSLNERLAALAASLAQLENPSAAIEPVVASPATVNAYLCYSQHDRERATVLMTQLEARGIRIWAVHRDRVEGSPFSSQVIAAITRAKLQILLVSKNVVASENVRFEMALASDDAKPVLCIRLDDVSLSGELALYVSSAAWADAPSDDAGYDGLANLAHDPKAGMPPAPSTPKYPDVFISYSTKNADVADAAVKALECSGFACYIAPRNQRAGLGWQGQLVRAVRESALTVLILSAAASSSDEVARELGLAAQAHKPIVPFKIQEFTVSDDLAYYVLNLHWIDAMTPPIEGRLNELVAHVQQMRPAL
jgi:hypothetical protein